MLCCQSGLIIRGSRTVSTTFPNSRITSKRDYDHLGSTESHTSTSRGIRDNFQRLPRPRSSAHWSRISMEFTHLLPPTLLGETQPPQHLSPSRHVAGRNPATSTPFAISTTDPALPLLSPIAAQPWRSSASQPWRSSALQRFFLRDGQMQWASVHSSQRIHSDLGDGLPTLFCGPMVLLKVS